MTVLVWLLLLCKVNISIIGHLELPGVKPANGITWAECSKSVTFKHDRTALSWFAPGLQEQELNAELDRFYVKPARSTGSQGVCLAQGVDGLIDAARDIIQEVCQHVCYKAEHL